MGSEICIRDSISADSPVPPAPVFDPATREPVTPEALLKLFPMPLIEQEVTTDRFVPIPDEVREVYKLYRPTPLLRARRLERELQTPAHIYYKYEGASPAGSHKLNTALAQAYYNKISGTHAMPTETGAGQWGSALAMAEQLLDALDALDIDVAATGATTDFLGLANHLRARAQTGLGAYDAAIAAYTTFLNAYPNPTESVQQRMAAVYSAAGNTDATVGAYRAAATAAVAAGDVAVGVAVDIAVGADGDIRGLHRAEIAAREGARPCEASSRRELNHIGSINCTRQR